jgi:cytochrome c biogenesis protein
MKSIRKFFESVKLTIVLFILLSLASVLGTLIPQGRSAAEYASRYGDLSGLLMTLQLTGLYQSPFYLSLLFLFALNTIFCTLARLGPKWRRAFRPSPEVDDKSLQSMRIKDRARIHGPFAAASERVRGALASRRYRVKTSGEGGRVAILAQKRRLGWFGSDIVHVGLLIILAGGVISGLTSRRAGLELRVGQTVDVPHAMFRMRLDRFETEYYPQGGVKAWKSTVTVVEDGAPVLTRVIEVNHPLTYKRFSFYQASYGWDWENPRLEIIVKKPADPGYLKSVFPKIGERLAVEDPDFTHLTVSKFVPDFVIGEGNEVQTRSLEPDNPAALVEVWKGEERVYSGWTFAKYPDFGEGHKVGQASLSFVLKSYEAPQFSVLEAAKDPGAAFIWLGCIFVTAGFFLAFYWPPREIRVVLEEAQGRAEAILGGFASKNRETFQTEFDLLVESLRRPK